MVRRITIKPAFPDHSKFLRAVDDTFISVASNGSTTGKLKIAIREKFWLAREAIAATIVRTDDNPRLPKSNARINNGIFTTMFPIKRIKKRKANNDRIAISKRL